MICPRPSYLWVKNKMARCNELTLEAKVDLIKGRLILHKNMDPRIQNSANWGSVCSMGT